MSLPAGSVLFSWLERGISTQRPRRIGSRAGIAVLAATLTLGVVVAGSPVDRPPITTQVTTQSMSTAGSSILDSVLSNDALGRPTLYGSTYNLSSAGVTFFGVDPVSGAVRTQLTMPGAYGGYHVAAAPDGRIYLGPQNSASAAQLWRYSPVSNTVTLVATMPTGIMCFGVTVFKLHRAGLLRHAQRERRL